MIREATENPTGNNKWKAVAQMGGNSHNEEDRVGGLGSDGSVDGILDLSGEHVLVEVLLHRHLFLLHLLRRPRRLRQRPPWIPGLTLNKKGGISLRILRWPIEVMLLSGSSPLQGRSTRRDGEG